MKGSFNRLSQSMDKISFKSMLLECSEQLLFFFDLRFTDYVT